MRLLPGPTNSEAAFVMIKQWIDDCVQQHPGCHRGQSNPGTPKRLLGVRNNFIALVDNPGNNPAYACLSHCWGKKPMFMTEKATLDQYKRHIPLDALSQTFQDAIEICRRLDIFLSLDRLVMYRLGRPHRLAPSSSPDGGYIRTRPGDNSCGKTERRTGWVFLAA